MQIIDGKLVAKVTREQIKQEVEGLKALNYPNAIGLAVILVGTILRRKFTCATKSRRATRWA